MNMWKTVILSTCVLSQVALGNTLLPKPNPYLAADILAITHVDSAATDSYPYTIPQGTFHIDLTKAPQVVGGPVNIITLRSTSPDYMWGISSGGVTYISTKGNEWKEVARISIPGIQQVTAQLNEKALGHAFTSIKDIEKSVKNIYKMDGFTRISNGTYSLVDKDNVAYANYGGYFIYAIGLKNKNNSSMGLQILRSLNFQSISKDAKERVAGLSMTYDGNIIILGNRSLTLITRDFKNILARVEFDHDEYISNSISVDENNGIYVASNKMMRKVVWTGTQLSVDEKNGAWSTPYETGQQPPVIKIGTGTGSTPTLMGFDNDKDKLVVITDGANQMHLVAFWRNNIPNDFEQQPGTKSRRIAGQISVTCGFKKLPPFIQSEQSVVVKDYGAFVVNNIGPKGHKDLLVGVMSLGPVFPSPQGSERFEWDVKKHKWSSVWTNPTSVSTSMVPIVSLPSNTVLLNGYSKKNGWEITGLNWDTGKVVHRTIFGQTNYGNGAYAIIELPQNNIMIFNSIAGPYRIDYAFKH